MNILLPSSGLKQTSLLKTDSCTVGTPSQTASIISVLETLGNTSRVVIILDRWMLIGRLGRPRRKWEHNMKMDLQDVALGIMDWIDLAQDRDR
jgi:hypothetical protein